MASKALTIVLAAGKGTRMKSRLPKALHSIAGRSLLGHVLAASGAAIDGEVAVVVGPGMEDVAGEAERLAPGARLGQVQGGRMIPVLGAMKRRARRSGGKRSCGWQARH